MLISLPNYVFVLPILILYCLPASISLLTQQLHLPYCLRLVGNGLGRSWYIAGCGLHSLVLPLDVPEAYHTEWWCREHCLTIWRLSLTAFLKPSLVRSVWFRISKSTVSKAALRSKSTKYDGLPLSICCNWSGITLSKIVSVLWWRR